MSSLMLAMALSVSPAATDDGFKLIHPNDLVTLQADKSHQVFVFDANDDEFRQKNGIIPGATLLKGHDYDVAATLPQDKASQLVFYCGNTKCMASHGAAARAVKAGYNHVDVLADGLLGWKDAGKPVAKP